MEKKMIVKTQQELEMVQHQTQVPRKAPSETPTKARRDSGQTEAGRQR